MDLPRRPKYWLLQNMRRPNSFPARAERRSLASCTSTNMDITSSTLAFNGPNVYQGLALMTSILAGVLYARKDVWIRNT